MRWENRSLTLGSLTIVEFQVPVIEAAAMRSPEILDSLLCAQPCLEPYYTVTLNSATLCNMCTSPMLEDTKGDGRVIPI